MAGPMTGVKVVEMGVWVAGPAAGGLGGPVFSPPGSPPLQASVQSLEKSSLHSYSWYRHSDLVQKTMAEERRSRGSPRSAAKRGPGPGAGGQLFDADQWPAAGLLSIESHPPAPQGSVPRVSTAGLEESPQAWSARRPCADSGNAGAAGSRAR